MIHTAETSSPGIRALKRFALVAGLIGALWAVMAFSASDAKADPVNYQFDAGVINLGGPEGTWAPLIDKSIPDPPATLKSEVAGDGSLTAAAEDFFFPTKKIEDLDVSDIGMGVLTFIDATIKISAEGPITGEFDTATGASELTIPADVFVTVYGANSPAFLAKCRIDGFDLELNTTAPMLSDPGAPADPPTPERPAADYVASPFDPADEQNGAMIASWTSLPSAKAEGGSLGAIVCEGLDGMLGGPGGTWLEGKAGDIEVVTPDPPQTAPKITGTPAATTESTSAEFQFTKGDAETVDVTGFQCKLDAGAFEPCDTGSVTYSDLAEGSHTFEVKATSEGGEGPSSTFTWEVTKTIVIPPGKAKLSKVTVKPGKKGVKRGKKATFTARVTNSGNAAATGVKVCVTAPKKLVSVKKCAKVGQIAAGASKSVKFKVTVKKKAKKGKKAVLRFKATSKNAGAKSAKATVKVK